MGSGILSGKWEMASKLSGKWEMKLKSELRKGTEITGNVNQIKWTNTFF